MRKLSNEKGFAMAEILAVCIVVLGLFVVLFSNYLPLTAEYDNKVTYNSINAEYAATYMRKAFKDVKVYSKLSDTIKRLDDKNYGYVTLYQCKDKDLTSCSTDTLEKVLGEGSSQYKSVKKLIDEYGVQEMILTRYKTDIVKEGYSEGDLLYNYIKQLPTYKDYKVTKTGKYRLILKTKDYGYATVPLRYALPNEPILKDEMIAVYYDDGWKVADQSNESVTHGWYDYVEKKWANAIIVKDDVNAKQKYEKPGTKVEEEDIKSMWVWIPRYKYEKFDSKKPTQINVTFLTLENTKDTVHPAFGGNTKNGFWIGKYEGSSGNKIIEGDTGNATQAIMDGDITNQEWGAVAYLAYSKYGTCSENLDGDVSCKGVLLNNEFKTGGGGVNSSTTNNHYGVFDMNGGRFEFVNGADKKDDGTGSSAYNNPELMKRTSTKYSKIYGKNYDYWFYNNDPCASAICVCKPGCCSENGCTCCRWRRECQGKQEQKASEARVATGCSGSTVKYTYYDYTSDGNLYYNWENNTYADDCTGEDSKSFNLRGGSAKGNAWCLKTDKEISSPDARGDGDVLKQDSGNNHYILGTDFDNKVYSEGIFSYSNSDYVNIKYITHRSVIRVNN